MKLEELTKAQLVEAAEVLDLKIKNVKNTTKDALVKVIRSQARREGANLAVLIEHVTGVEDGQESEAVSSNDETVRSTHTEEASTETSGIANETPNPLKTSRPRTGVGKTSTEYLLAHPDWTDQQILEKVNAAHPQNETTKQCISWYRAKLRREGQLPAKAPKQAEAK